MSASSKPPIERSTMPCRACSTEHINSSMIGLFREDSLVNIFIQFTSLEIHEMDGLPEYICELCYSQLLNFKDFKQICISSDEMFRQKATIKEEIEINNFNDDVNAENKVDVKTEIEESFDYDNDNDNYCDDDFIDINNIVHSKERDLSPIRKTRKRSAKKKKNPIKPVAVTETREKFICDMCKKTFHKKHRIEAHLRTHLGLKPFECSECNVSFRKWATFVLHNKVNHGEKEYQKFSCHFEGCDKSYNLKQSLQIHLRTRHYGIPHRKSNTSFICETCGKSFTQQFSLKEHIYTHTGETPFVCEQCPKKFISKYKLKVHTMRHNNIRNHVCSVCGLRKTTQRELRAHMNLHTKEKSFPCELCPAVFGSYQNYNRHNRIVHRGHKPYVCTYCQRAFSKAETLKHHTMTHTGEKPHACPICDKRFIQAIALKTHLRTHNKHKIY